mgnify:CR=1 FL=1
MDEEIERLMVSVRADTRGFSRDVDSMRQEMEGPFAAGVQRAGRSVETTLIRAIRSGKLGFEELEKVAVAVLDTIAAKAIEGGIAALLGGGGEGSAAPLAGALLSALVGLPGRATGGPVSPARPYLVGERGPEWFVPTTSGNVVPQAAGGPREVRVSININAGGSDAPQALARSGRQVARAVKAALAEAG